MKVLLIGPFPFPIDGCSFANETLRRNLALKDIKCGFINTNAKQISSEQGNKFSLIKTISFLKTYVQLYKIFRSEIVYFTTGQTFFGVLKYAPFMFTCKILGKKYVLHLHGNHLGTQYSQLNGVRKKILEFLLSGASAGIVLSESLRKNFTGLIDNDKIFVVENFAENSLYEITNLIKNDDKLRVVYLSNLIKEKGIIDLLDALTVIKNEGIDFETTIAGALDMESKEEVLKRIEHLGDNIKYIGVATGSVKANLLAEANVFVLPTYYPMEGQPISILEALATGNIIISTNHAGIPDVISQNNGFLVPIKSPSSIADCLKKISGSIGECINKFAIKNREYALSKFTEEKFSGKIIEVLRNVSESK